MVSQKSLTSDEATGLLKVITDYTCALDILDKYDHEKLTIEKISENKVFKISYDIFLLFSPCKEFSFFQIEKNF